MRKRPLPTGTVTFLFTDIEGSTALWERDDAAMRLALAKHDRTIKKAVAAANGVVFKKVGDASYCAFARSEDAVAAAVTAQRALGKATWPQTLGSLHVRMALHTGTAHVREGDYFGPTLNRVARLLGLAHGEQILVSDATVALLQDRLPEDVALRDLGSHRLRNMTSRERAYQVLAPGLRAEFPQIVSIDVAPNNLPAQLSSFVGRAEELAKIDVLVRENRLVTIAGPGGIGKTRLALKAADGLHDAFPDGIFFVTFAPLEAGSDLAAVAAASTAALGVKEMPGETLVDAMTREVRDRRLLLIADNLEHVIPAAAALVKALAERCPNSRILSTSREQLHVRGEVVIRIPPMTIADARTLFAARADSGSFAGVSASGESSTIDAICTRLDGIPLALELAAARTTTYSVRDLRERLDEPLKMLVSKDSTEEHRHRTLTATIAWSFDLLDASDQSALTSLSAFRGGFTIPAALYVCQDGSRDDEALERAIDSLIDKSFIARDPHDSERGSLLETISSFAQNTSTPADFDRICLRHFEYFRNLASELAASASANPERAVAAFEAEAHNFDRALRVGSRDKNLLTVDIACDLTFFWQISGRINRGRSLLDDILSDHTLTAAPSIAKLYRRASTLATIDDDYDAARHLVELALASFRRNGDDIGVLESRYNLAVIAQREGEDVEAAREYATCIDSFRERGHGNGTVACANNLAQLALKRGEVDLARRYLDEALQLVRRTENPLGYAGVLTTMGVLERTSGNLDAAEDHLRAVLSESAHLRNHVAYVDAMNVLSTVHCKQRRYGDAELCASEALDLAHELESSALTALCLERLVEVYVRTNRFELAAVTLGKIASLRTASRFAYDGNVDDENMVDRVTAALGAKLFEALLAQGFQDLELSR